MDVLQRARQLYERGEMHDALEAAQSAAEHAPRDAEAWALLAAISRHAGFPHASDQAFRRASELSRRKPLPVRVSPAEFGRLVERSRKRVSPDAQRRLARTRVEVAGLPSAADVRAGIKPDAVSSRIRVPEDLLTLYQVNLENRSRTMGILEANVEKVLSRA